MNRSKVKDQGHRDLKLLKISSANMHVIQRLMVNSDTLRQYQYFVDRFWNVFLFGVTWPLTVGVRSNWQTNFVKVIRSLWNLARGLNLMIEATALWPLSGSKVKVRRSLRKWPVTVYLLHQYSCNRTDDQWWIMILQYNTDRITIK